MNTSKKLFADGAKLYSQGDDLAAKNIFRRLLKDDPKNIELLNRYAVTCMNTGEYDRAIDASRRSLELAPELPDTYLICGLAYYHSGDIINSEKSFLKSLELNPSRSDIKDLWESLKSKPYFSVAGGIQSIHAPERHVFMSAVVDLLNRERQHLNILEIGTYAGSSTLTWANAVDKLFDGEGNILCIDAWGKSGPEQYEKDMEEALQSNHVYEAFLHNAALVPQCVKIEHIRALSEEVLPHQEDASFDVIYIDGCHYYQEVLNDITESKRIVSNGGIICGDDLEMKLYEVDNVFATSNRNSDYIEDPKTGNYYHPGVTLAVNESFATVSQFQGFWAMRRVGNDFCEVSFENGTGVLPKHMPPEIIEKIKTYFASSSLLGRLLTE